MIQEGTLKFVIFNYLSRYLEQFRINLHNAIEHYDPEAIHEYRVSVKRIRAIIAALDDIYRTPLFSGKMIQPLRRMFKAGGSIRDDQVQIGLVEMIEEKYGQSFLQVKSFYRQRIVEQRNSFFQKAVDFDFTSLDCILEEIESALEPQEDQLLEQGLYRGLNESMEKLRRKRYDLDKPEKLHRFRTKFKQNGYIAEMVYQSQQSNKVTKAAYSRMKNFGQELGNWHDHYQLMMQTAAIFKDSKSMELLGEAFELRKILTPEHDRLFQEILHLIKRDDSLFSV